MPSFGILCAAMFRFERERVLHCSLYCGTVATYPVYFGDGNHISGLCLQREMAVAYTFSSPIPSAFLCLCYYLPYLHGTVKPEHAALVPRYRSKWQDHVGTSALRCRPLASYVPLCSDLSGSASCTAPCIAGRWLHTRSISGTVITYPVSAYSGRWLSHTHSLPLSQVLFYASVIISHTYTELSNRSMPP